MNEFVTIYLIPLLFIMVFSYFLGCFNGAVIVSKYILKDDVRNHGSGNAGLTNFYRSFGGVLTFVVILTDMLKGVFALLTARLVIAGLDLDIYLMYAEYLAAITCMMGHMFPITFKFKGGKGVLTGGAIVLMLDWRVALVVWVGFFILFLSTKYVSLGSCSAGFIFICANAYFHPDIISIILGSVMGGLLLWGHRGNMKRLIQGEESKFQLRKKKDS